MYIRKGRILTFATGGILGSALMCLTVLLYCRVCSCGRELSSRKWWCNLQMGPVAASQSREDETVGLVFLLDSNPFMYINARNGRVTHLIAVNSVCPDAPRIFSVQAGDAPGYWERLCYPAYVPQHGCVYEDLEVDGMYDVKTMYAEDGTRRVYICLESAWYEVEVVDYEKRSAHTGGTGYVFEPHVGWAPSAEAHRLGEP